MSHARPLFQSAHRQRQRQHRDSGGAGASAGSAKNPQEIHLHPLDGGRAPAAAARPPAKQVQLTAPNHSPAPVGNTANLPCAPVVHCGGFAAVCKPHLLCPSAPPGEGCPEDPGRLGVRGAGNGLRAGLSEAENLHPRRGQRQHPAADPGPRAHPSGQGGSLDQAHWLSGPGAPLVQSPGMGQLHPAVQGHRDGL